MISMGSWLFFTFLAVFSERVVSIDGPNPAPDIITLYTVLDCIRLNGNALCPGELATLQSGRARDLVIDLGWPLNSKAIKKIYPTWRESWHVPRGDPDINLNTVHNVYVGADYCLYNGDWPNLSSLRIGCPKTCYTGVELPNPWFEKHYGGKTPDFSQPISGVENRNRENVSSCPKRWKNSPYSDSRHSSNPEGEEWMGLSAAAAAPVFPAEARDRVIDENHVEPGTNDDRLQAWTGSTDRGNGEKFNVGSSTAITYAAADRGNIGQAVLNQFAESLGTWWKRNTLRQQRRPRGRLI